jgi:hypothetical protein
MWMLMYVAVAASATALVAWYASVPEMSAERIALRRQARRTRPSEDDWA